MWPASDERERRPSSEVARPDPGSRADQDAGPASRQPRTPQLFFEILRDPLLVPDARHDLDAQLRRHPGLCREYLLHDGRRVFSNGGRADIRLAVLAPIDQLMDSEERKQSCRGGKKAAGLRNVEREPGSVWARAAEGPPGKRPKVLRPGNLETRLSAGGNHRLFGAGAFLALDQFGEFSIVAECVRRSAIALPGTAGGRPSGRCRG